MATIQSIASAMHLHVGSWQRVAYAMATGILTLFVIATLVIGIKLPHAWSLAGTPETAPLSELAFVNTAKLPKKMSPHVGSSFEFAIANRQATQASYGYRVLVTENNQTHELTHGTIDLPSDTSTTLSATITPNKAHEIINVTVELISQPQQIHFWSKS